MAEGDRLPDRPPDASRGNVLAYETPPPVRDRRLTLAIWLAIAPLMLVCVVAPVTSPLGETNPVAAEVIGWVFVGLFIGLIIASALTLIGWTRARWKTASSRERFSAGVVCFLLVLYLALLVTPLLD